jgi:hypothetical protein
MMAIVLDDFALLAFSELILPCIQMSKMRLGSTEQIAIVQEHLASHDSGVSECVWV